MELIATTFIVPALIVLLAAAGVTKGFDVLGLHLDTDNAYGVVVAIFDCLLLLFTITGWKAGDFLKMCPESEAGRAIAAVLTHKWFLNPFCYSGRGVASAVTCGVGSGLLIMIWCIGLCSLQLLSTVTHGRGGVEKVLFALYLIFGVTSALGIVRLFRLILQRIDRAEDTSDEFVPLTVSDIKLNIVLKSAFAVTAIIVGFWLYYSFAHIGI
ncbi:hypothetical protein [Acidicapsa dinghuensis]